MRKRSELWRSAHRQTLPWPINIVKRLYKRAYILCLGWSSVAYFLMLVVRLSGATRLSRRRVGSIGRPGDISGRIPLSEFPKLVPLISRQKSKDGSGSPLIESSFVSFAQFDTRACP